MKNLGVFLCIAFIKIVTSQVISYVPRNAIANPGLLAANQQNAMAANAMAANAMAANAMAANANSYRVVPSNAITVSKPPQNNIITNIPATQAAAANANIANAQAANAAMANVLNENAALAASRQELTGTVTNADLANIASSTFAGTNPNLAALASMANINGNIATFNFGNDGHGFTVTSGSPGNQGFGIQVLADALEVGGTVAVNGQIPIFGAVALNGNLPTDGSASVNYSCGRQASAPVPE
ncbi:unnamed protein product [Danaus chrysippus]|uniref:(African queen) hypothetical protein n=1 Tax=Danaus chrysippus TaxID=151541 RepID=A0A8J2R7M0_9NEOP|nr:unnamed protein product [Danaus chrysippus]